MPLDFAEPTTSGGQTPLADSRRVLSRLSARVRDTFAERRVLYVRNYGHGVDLPWQDVFQTSDPREVERFCRTVGMELEWTHGDRLTTRHVCQAIAAHPESGESVWFNKEGQIIKRAQYSNGMLNGDVIDYFPSGAVREKASYKDDKLDGEYIRYYETGVVAERAFYNDGKPYGDRLEFDESGDVKDESGRTSTGIRGLLSRIKGQ